MTTLLQTVIALQDLIAQNPELASFEVRMINYKTLEIAGNTPKGLGIGTKIDNKNKTFDIYVGLADDDFKGYEKYKNKYDKCDDYAEYKEQSNIIQLLDNLHDTKRELDKYLKKLVIKCSSGNIYHNFSYKYGDTEITCKDVRVGGDYSFTYGGLIMHIQGDAEVL